MRSPNVLDSAFSCEAAHKRLGERRGHAQVRELQALLLEPCGRTACHVTDGKTGDGRNRPAPWDR